MGSLLSFILFLTRIFLIFQGVRFDPEVNQALRIEFARTNTKVSKMAYRNGGTKMASPTDGVTPRKKKFDEI